MSERHAQRRITWFRRHLIAYAAIAVVLVVADLAGGGGLYASIFFIVGWGAPLALHTAFVMGLIGGDAGDS